jgi:hypothetical protein
MKRIVFVNTDTDGLCRSIRACYGKCGFISFLIDTGQGITGVIEFEDEGNIVCNERS